MIQLAMVIDVSLSSFISSFVALHSVIDNRCLRPFGVGFGGLVFGGKARSRLLVEGLGVKEPPL